MLVSLPFSLLVAWVVYFGFLNTHQRHAARFRGASQGALELLNLSVIAGSIVGLILLGYYFTQVSWYWPIVLFVAGSIIGGLLFGLFDAWLGQLTMTFIGFLGWPAAAAWVFFIVRGLTP
jgi:hypothetical protein